MTLMVTNLRSYVRFSCEACSVGFLAGVGFRIRGQFWTPLGA
jgi:hypothetical protein